MVSDGSGGVVFVWIVFRATSKLADLRAQRVDADGNLDSYMGRL